MTRIAVLLALMIPCEALAQTIGFRSGEHDTFSRIVVEVPRESNWQLSEREDGYSLVLSPAPEALDLSGAFERIPRDRVANIRLESDEIIFELACTDCHADAFRWQDDELVVDFIDGPAPEAVAQQTTERDVAVGQPLEPLTLLPISNQFGAEVVIGQTAPNGTAVIEDGASDSLATEVVNGTEESASLSGEDQAPRAVADALGQQLPTATELQLPSALDDALEAAPRVNELEQALIEGLSRATSQGLLTPSGVALPTSDPRLSSGNPVGPPEPAPSQAPELPGLPGIAARTAIERDNLQRAIEPRTTTGADCFPETLFDVGSWSDERSFHAQLGELRYAITSDTGEPRPDVTLSLVKLYIHYGFGVEALALLERLEGRASESDVLALMARVVDGLPPRNKLLAGQEGCPSDVALWAVLSSDDPLSAAGSDPNSVVQTLRRLPSSLRGHLGQRLAEMFADNGDVVTAEALLIVARAGVTASPQAEQIVEASIADRAGETEVAIETLSELAETDSRISPETLIEVIELSIEEGRFVDEDTLSLAEVMRFEHASNDALVAKLKAAEVSARLSNRQFLRAIDLVSQETSLPSYERIGFMSEAVLGITADFEDDAFLNFAYSGLPSVDAATENAVARRLVGLGFHERADAVLTADARQVDALERRFLRAEIALNLEQYDEVKTILSGIEDTRAIELRVAALAAEENYAEALALSESVGLPMAEDPLLAWRAGETDQSSDQSSDAYSALSAVLARTSTEARPSALPPLAERRSMVSDSEETRELISNMLGEFDLEAAINSLPSN